MLSVRCFDAVNLAHWAFNVLCAGTVRYFESLGLVGEIAALRSQRRLDLL